MGREDNRVIGWIMIILGAIFFPVSAVQMLKGRARLPGMLRINWVYYTFYGTLTGWGRVRLILGILLLIGGPLLILLNLEDPWDSHNSFRQKRAVKKIGRIMDTDLLAYIKCSGTSDEIRKTAAARRQALMLALLETNDLPAIRRELNSIIPSRLDTDAQDFLAKAAKKQPALVLEFWPQLQKWAHADSTSHSDQQPGAHTDRTQYYDYTVYRDGHMSPNYNGRRSHTDQRSYYGDCHDDRHADSSTHSDKANEENLTRFRPAVPEK